jgi:diguanylate cyclase (GGDEF)-like protein
MPRKTDNEPTRNELVRSEEIQKQLHALSSRDVQLWSIGLLIMLVLSAGFLALVFPNMSWRPEININGRLLPQFFFGLMALIVLFNMYVISQKKTMNATRRELIRELVFNERMESLSLLDPATQLFNRRGVDQLLSQEVARANRMGTGLTILVMKLESLQVVNARFGLEAGDKFIGEAAKLLRNTFRGSDTLARYSGSEFLVIMPGTAEPQAEFAVKRFQDAVDQWNLATRTGWEMNYICGLATHVSGSDAGDLLRNAERKLVPVREKLVPVFLPIDHEAGRPSHLVV